MIDHSDVMERTCEVADFLTRRHCKRCMIEAIVYPDDPRDCTTYTEEAQGIFDDYYDYLEPIIGAKMVLAEIEKLNKAKGG